MRLLPDTDFGARAAAHLRDDMVAWLTTVAADGTPQPNPVWLLWDGATQALVYNRPDAHRLAHVAERPQVAVHFDGDGHGGDIVVLAATARPAPDTVAADRNEAYLAKYATAMARVSGSVEAFAQQYSVPLLLELRRLRGH